VAKEEVAFRIVEKMEKEYREEEIKREEKKERSKEMQEILDKNKWYQILQEFKGYPEKYRNLIWISMLEVPRNYSVFSSLLDKGTHTAFEGLQEVLQLSDGSLLKTLQGTLSCLAHWAPFLANVEYLPEFVFPFVKVFHSNPLLCFEVTVTIISKWALFFLSVCVCVFLASCVPRKFKLSKVGLLTLSGDGTSDSTNCLGSTPLILTDCAQILPTTWCMMHMNLKPK
ncbi:TBC1 domain family member 31-like, partial [Homarus americanus]